MSVFSRLHSCNFFLFVKAHWILLWLFLINIIILYYNAIINIHFIGRCSFSAVRFHYYRISQTVAVLTSNWHFSLGLNMCSCVTIQFFLLRFVFTTLEPTFSYARWTYFQPCITFTPITINWYSFSLCFTKKIR